MAKAAGTKDGKFEPPVGMPTVFDPAFKGEGQKAGLVIFRIEQFKVIKKSVDDKCYQGQLYEGDAYIILYCKQRDNALDKHIYFWLGKDSSQDEQGCAAYKTVELDMYLGDEAVQHREVQNGESDEFLSLFKNGVRYLEGGVASGFKHVDREAFTTRLLHVKGRRNIRIKQVDLKPESMNSGDVFILDAGRNIFQWNGKQASNVEKVKGLEITKQIRDQERGGNASIAVIDEGKDDDKEFWLKFGCAKPAKIKTAEAGGDDEKHSRDAASNVSLFEVSSASGSIKTTPITARPLKKELLDTKEAYILDMDGASIFVWVGRGADKDERLHSMKIAMDYVKSKGYPTTIPVVRLGEGCETPVFKQNFVMWPEKDATKGPAAPGSAKKAGPRPTFDTKSLHTAGQRETYIMPDQGTGELVIYRVENFELVEWPKARYGEFYGGDSFVLQYKYQVGNRDHIIIYFWQGLTSSQDEKGASAIHARDLGAKFKEEHVLIRVVQNKEPQHFYLLFKGKMIVHAGGHASGFKNRNDKDEYFKDGDTRMFQVRGTNEFNCRAVQVPVIAGSLNSGDVFILETPKNFVIWCGAQSTGDEREYAKTISKKLNSKEYQLVLEDKEPQAFWDALGGKTEYQKAKDPEVPYKTPRLFQCSNARGYFYVEEIFDFDQEDLIEEDVMLLDTYSEVFIWIGDQANAEEKKNALETAIQYVKTDTSGRKESDTTFIVVKQGAEPPNFTGHFMGWNLDKWSSGKSYADLKKAIGGGGELTTSLGSELSKFAIAAKYTFAQLTAAALPEGVDPTIKEQYLLEDEFKGRFGMSRAEFNALPAWKRSGAKKKAGLY